MDPSLRPNRSTQSPCCCSVPNQPLHCNPTHHAVQQRKISLLGSTGSIGTQTLDICAERPDLYEVTALAAGNNVDLLAQQIVQFRPKVRGVCRSIG
jgi:hypothetical protein